MCLLRCLHLINRFQLCCNGVLLKSKIVMVSLVFTGYGFVLPYIQFMHLAFLDHSMPDYLCRVLTVKLNMACPKYCIVLKSYVPVNDADL